MTETTKALRQAFGSSLRRYPDPGRLAYLIVLGMVGGLVLSFAVFVW